MKLRIVYHQQIIGGYKILYYIVNDDNIIINFDGLLPRGNRRAVCWFILKRLRFKYVEAQRLEAKLTKEAGALLIWLANAKGPSGLSKSELKKLSKMSIPKMYKYFETVMILERL